MDNALLKEAREYAAADNHSPDGYAEHLVHRLVLAYEAQAALLKDADKIADALELGFLAEGLWDPIEEYACARRKAARIAVRKPLSGTETPL